jgi:hypothetical protein
MDDPASSPTPAPPSQPSHRGRVILCLASYFKGNDFLEQCHREGCHVILVTLEPLLGKPWAREFIDEVFAVHSLTDRRTVVNSISYLARSRDIARITPLDDYDVETAAHLREHLRIPGMGETTARYFRDKLAMRARARDRGIAIPEFVHVLNHARVHHFLSSVPAPWLLKPRGEASSVGIRRLERAEDVWKCIEELGDAQPNYLIERMIPGDVFHVDAIVSEKQVVFAEVHQYHKPLFELIHQGGGIFASRTVQRGSELEKKILATHTRVIEHLGLVRGVTHTEFIVGKDDGEVYFLETAARVGGAHISDLVEASTGINLWKEWAKIEIAQGEEPYTLPPRRHDYGGLILSLARQETPDTSAYTDPEIAWRMTGHPAHHVGFVLRAGDPGRVQALLEQYQGRIARDFMATMPAPREATS